MCVLRSAPNTAQMNEAAIQVAYALFRSFVPSSASPPSSASRQTHPRASPRRPSSSLRAFECLMTEQSDVGAVRAVLGVRKGRSVCGEFVFRYRGPSLLALRFRLAAFLDARARRLGLRTDEHQQHRRRPAAFASVLDVWEWYGCVRVNHGSCEREYYR
ncbi:hypothetical protein C8R45DRAFT_426533 [Mycena sanguinolenta]|nr:hypothetical protein C8R45DRAFT_426533 [Mycena sanguinolenta]